MTNANAEFGMLLMRNSSLMAQSDVFDHPEHPFTQWMREFESATFGIVKTVGHQTAALNAWNAAVTACSSIDALASLAPAAVEGDTYVAPAHGWTCFHCGQTFPACAPHLAAEHFGESPSAQPGCMLRVSYGAEMAALRALRKTEAQVAALTAQCEADAKRLDWIENWIFQAHWGANVSEPCTTWSIQTAWRHKTRLMYGPNDFRTAIDSAIAAGNGEGV